MGFDFFHKAASALANHLWRAQILDLCCTSIRGNRSLTLPDRLLGSADEIQIRFSVRWPVRPMSPVRRVRAGLWAWPASVQARHLNPANTRQEIPEGSEPVREDAWELEQSRTGRTTHVRIRLRMEALRGYQGIQLEIRGGHQERCLSRLEFEIIDEVQAQRLRLEGLKATGRQLWIQSGNQQHPGELVAETSDFVAPEFTIPASELGEVLPAYQARLTWRLDAGQKEIWLGGKWITLGRGAIRLRSDPISVKDRTLFPEPGAYRLIGAIAGRDVARFPFRLVDHQEWLQQLKVERIDLVAETVGGQQQLQRGALHWGSHLAFQPLVRIDTAIPAPNSSIRCTARLRRGEAELRREEFFLHLNQTSQWVRLHRFNLLDLDPSLHSKHIRLNLTIEVNAKCKIDWTIIVLPTERVSNFEGQLNCSSEDLSLDERAYEEIVADLLANQPPRKTLR